MNRTESKKLQTQIERFSTQFKKLDTMESSLLRERWINEFTDASAKVKSLQFLWQVFSLGLVSHVSGDVARNSFRSVEDLGFYVLPAGKTGASYRCMSSSQPNFEGKGYDILLVSLNFTWTMAYNHEGYGPFFMRQEKEKCSGYQLTNV